MAFVSTQTLLAPFKNTVHLTAIFMVALLFAVFRLNGGGFSVDDGVRKRPARTQPRVIAAPAERLAAPPTTESLSTGSLASSIKRQKATGKSIVPVKKKAKSKPKRKSDSLADIEKQLGLR